MSGWIRQVSDTSVLVMVIGFPSTVSVYTEEDQDELMTLVEQRDS